MLDGKLFVCINYKKKKLEHSPGAMEVLVKDETAEEKNKTK